MMHDAHLLHSNFEDNHCIYVLTLANSSLSLHCRCHTLIRARVVTFAVTTSLCV